MSLLKSGFALIRGNVKCLLNKICYPASFYYKPKLRVYSGVSITLRNRGKIALGNNIKIDSQALIASNGGEIQLGDGVGIGRNNIVVSQECISIGNNTILGPNVLIYDHDHKFEVNKGVSVSEYSCKCVSIGNNCWIGANTVILKGTIIGNNCLIGAGSVIKGVFPDGSKIVQKRNTEIFGEKSI